MVAGNNDSTSEDMARLVDACLQGNEAAWTVMANRYRGAVARLVLSAGLAPADADDIFQNVCMKLWLHLRDVREPEKLNSWVAAVTRQECYRLSRRKDQQHTELSEVLPDKAPSLDAQLIEQEHRELLRIGLTRLSPRCRQLLELLYSDDRPPYTEISARLNLPVGSIGPRRARCLEYLRRRIRDLTD